jgi:hypothetical protein
MPYLTTRSGTEIELTDVRAQHFKIEDIAYALAGERRYAANAPLRFNVAHHSVVVSMLCPPALALAGLLHDAAEMLTGDIPKPVKTLIASDALTRLVKRIDAAIAERFGVDPKQFESPILKQADRKAWRWEQIGMYGPAVLDRDERLRDIPWDTFDDQAVAYLPLLASDLESEWMFLQRFRAIVDRDKKQNELDASPFAK